ncbi:MAG: glycoside hydrolase family 73 protein [Saprospiraceae bacterium]
MKRTLTLKFTTLKTLLLIAFFTFPNTGFGFVTDTTKVDTLMNLNDFFMIIEQEEKEKKQRQEEQKENSTIDTTVMTFVSKIPQRQLQDYHQKAFDYVDRFAHIAVAEQEKYHIPASITLAQGLIESGFGKSKMARTINNHFGIKCTPGQKRQRGRCYTFHDDTRYDKFLKFESAWASYRYHSKVLQNERYKSLYELEMTDYEGWAIGLQKAGYASDKNYAKKLIRIIELYELYEYDEE